MVEHYHGDIKVNWTDGEWERLQKAIAKKHRGEIRDDYVRINFSIPPWLHDKMKEYAKMHSISVSELVRNVLYIFAS